MKRDMSAIGPKRIWPRALHMSAFGCKADITVCRNPLANAAEWRATMTDLAPRIDFANLPTPAEGILVTLFITVRKVARSRDFYSRVLGGTVVLDENPCMVKLSNSWIIM